MITKILQNKKLFNVIIVLVVCFIIIFSAVKCFPINAHPYKTYNSNTIFLQQLDNKVNINTAPINVLMKLQGIGEAKATLIIEYRQKNKGFSSVDEIKNVYGIGDKIFNSIKDKITI